MTQVNTELLEALKAFVNQAHFIWREDDEGMIAARAAIARAEAKQAEPQKREFPEDTFAFDPNDFLYQKGLHDGKLIEQAERVEPVMDIDLAKMVVRSAGYSLVSQRFIVNFAEFIQDWRKGDFELSPLAACDVEACFEAWQEEVNQKEVSTPPAAERVEPVRGNIGHGHVWSRPDGLKVRCGGPTICVVCAKDAASVATPPASAVSEPLTDSYVQKVPDKCELHGATSITTCQSKNPLPHRVRPSVWSLQSLLRGTSKNMVTLLILSGIPINQIQLGEIGSLSTQPHLLPQ